MKRHKPIEKLFDDKFWVSQWRSHKDDDKNIINELKSLVYGSVNKNGLKAAIDLVESSYPKLPALIKRKYDELNESEFNVCLLSLLPLSSREIANIMDLGESSVAKARSNIRKKIGVEGYGSDISDFIFEEFYSRKHWRELKTYETCQCVFILQETLTCLYTWWLGDS